MIRTVVRLVVLVVSAAAGGATARALEAPVAAGGVAGALAGGAAVLLEIVAASLPIERLVWGVAGGLAGLGGGLVLGLVAAALVPQGQAAVVALALALGGYVGAGVARRQDRHERLQPEQAGGAGRRGRAERQRAGERGEAGDAPRRGDDRPGPSRGQGIGPGRRVPRRRHDGRDRAGPPIHRPGAGRGRHKRAPDAGGPHDLHTSARRRAVGRDGAGARRCLRWPPSSPRAAWVR